MPFLIDGSNLGGAMAGAAGARDRRAVVARLLPWARRRARVLLVFDGPADPGLAERYGPLEVRFSGAESADRVILRTLGSCGRDWLVATGDAKLAAECRERGARIVSPDELLERVERAPGSPLRERAGNAAEPMVDVAEWEEYFRRGREE